MTEHTPLNDSETTYVLLSDVSEVCNITMSPPWYYQFLIKLIKPIYRFVLWKRYRTAKKKGLTVVDYKQEIDNRFGRHYPEPPVLESYSSKVNEGSELEKRILNTHSADQSSLNDSSFNKTALNNSSVNKNTFAKTEPSLFTEQPSFYNSTIWCHAVSLGETNTIAPMLKNLLQQGAKIWITNTTQTGYARTEKIFADAIQSRQMVHTFVPVDDKAIVEKFISQVKPDLAMFVETELWANILHTLKALSIPSVLVNARLSQKSFKNYAKFEAVSKSMMFNLSVIIAQDADSAKRFRKLGTQVPKIRLADSLKWSSIPIESHQFYAPSTKSPEFSNKFSSMVSSTDLSEVQSKFALTIDALNRPIWVAGSTHAGEEVAIIEAHKRLIEHPSLSNALLIIVPRHPERFEEVAELVRQSGLRAHRRSQDEKIELDTQIYLADTMGELMACYELADVVFVGGSLVNVGGHNPIEASGLAKPVIMGEYTQSCHELVTALSGVGALKVVKQGQPKSKSTQDVTHNSNHTLNQNLNRSTAHSFKDTPLNDSTLNNSNDISLLEMVQYWLLNPELAQQAGQKGHQLVLQKSDAMQKQLAIIEALYKDHNMPKDLNPPESQIVDLDHFEVRQRADI